MNNRGNYYRVSIKQVAPSPLFGDWDGTWIEEEDVFAYSEDGAYRSVKKNRNKGNGIVSIITGVLEIPKADFRGQHKVKKMLR